MDFKFVRILANPNKDYAPVMKKIISFLSKRGVTTFFGEIPNDEEDLVISLGGDGTMLKAAKTVRHKDIPLLGINLGNLGFLADIKAQDTDLSLEELARGDYRLERRINLRVDGTSDALNDVVVMPRMSFRVIHLLSFVNGNFLTEIVGDGVIISTPTGSTAYSLSAGGPIVQSDMDLIIINSISPHSLSLRPIIIPPDSKVKITLCSESAFVAIDGQTAKNISKGDEIEIAKSDSYTTLLRLKSVDYFSTLRSKLKLGDTKMKTSCGGCKNSSKCYYFSIHDD
ncbi:NAD(+)/NADH kinase [candidate division WOR-3 bacterium]|nr:NAD(+)/NADH kinase [candidate division WOR-3 bacterium]